MNPLIDSSTNVQQCLVVTRGTQLVVVVHLNVNKRGGKPQAPTTTRESERRHDDS